MNGTESFGVLLRNRISLVGLFAGLCAFVTGTALLIIDARQENQSPYVSLLIYLVIPLIMAGCGVLVVAGMLWTRRRLRRRGVAPRAPVIDFGDRRTLVRLALFAMLGGVLAVVAAVTAYRAYHFTESVQFCGQVCHEPMKPEHVAFKHSPHANLSCVDCHIGPGAKWFVKAKISGLYQVYAVLTKNYHRPIAAPVENLRPAKETCLTCHWPTKFFGAVLRTWTYYRTDEKNSPWTVKMLMNIGGGDPAHGPIRGIHWHMDGVNSVEYIATDPKRLVIPWVRVTDQTGKVTVYRTTDKALRLDETQADGMHKRRMDCIDCHNRPSHRFWTPNESLDMSLSAGRIDAAIPSIKSFAANLLAAEYQTEAEALEKIDSGLRAEYPDDPRIEAVIREVKTIYSANFFPEMKARWTEYPNHLAHKITPGCFRCHDGEHVSESGERISKDCNTCHTILAQGPGVELAEFTSTGLEFQHPEDIGEDWKTERCDTCHTGSP